MRPGWRRTCERVVYLGGSDRLATTYGERPCERGIKLKDCRIAPTVPGSEVELPATMEVPDDSSGLVTEQDIG